MCKKVCKSCNVEKDLNQYRKTLCKKNNKFYYRSQCKECENKENSNRQKENYLLNKEKIKERNKKYYEKIKNNNDFIEKNKKYNKKYREINKIVISEKRKKRYRDNIEKEKEYKKQYYYTHKDKIKEANKVYYETNKEMIFNKEKEKRQKDENYRLKKQIRTMIWKSFYRNGITKNDKCEKILGCNLDFFYNYLLQTFKSNYGYEWDKIEPIHIDHILPISLAKNKNDVIELCHYSNLQLLKAQDNFQKSNNINWKLNN